ncbi:MAG TPA: RNA 2',3'-cyclic phosphodiesterase [Prolixibacteraceae bacterium]|nr:RNA 2',3'-cyclic phosphodiesterase [Prolixibacteraceae bacterium]HRV88279.1 RNA 2',3'-cyclic phosphodiesterase [Prolixibacteraceae bacterium]
MRRTFIAIPVEAAAPLRQLTEQLKVQFRGEAFSWVDPANFHVTVRFLGDTDEGMILPIAAAMRAACLEARAWPGTVRGLDYFSFKGTPSVLFARIGGWEGALRLATTLDRELEGLGFPPGDHPFKAHLALARIRNLHDKKRFKEVITPLREKEFQEAEASRIIHYESILGPQGPLYKAITVIHLSGGAPT